MEVVSPTGRDIDKPVIPFSHGAMAYADGYPLSINFYDVGTVEHARFAAGWLAAASIADGEAVAHEVAVVAVSGAAA
jgi:hypothetical protein